MGFNQIMLIGQGAFVVMIKFQLPISVTITVTINQASEVITGL